MEFGIWEHWGELGNLELGPSAIQRRQLVTSPSPLLT